MDLPLHDCAVLLSSIPLTATAKKDSTSNALFAKLAPSGGKSSSPATAAANNKAFQDSLQKNTRTFVEEGNEDLVVLGAHEALFSKAGLVAQPETPDRQAHLLSPEGQASGSADSTGNLHLDDEDGGVGEDAAPGGGECDRTDYLVDVLHLKTAKSTLLAAKRINLPNAERRSLVAVMHEEQYVHFYSVDEDMAPNNNREESSLISVPPVSRQWVKANGATEPFAVFHSMIRTGTFGSKTLAAIRFFCWIPEYSAVAKHNGYDGFCLIVTEGNINIVAVSTSKAQKPTTVVASVNTRCDYVEYLPRRRFLMAINSTRSSIVKCFFIDLPVPDGIRKLTELKVESDNGVMPTTSNATHGIAAGVASLVGSVAPVSNAMMPHRGDRLVIPVILYDVVYIVDAVLCKSELHLYAWQAPNTSNPMELANSIVKKYVLPVSEELWPIQVVTVDNLLVVQQKNQGNLCHTYDVKLLPPDQLVHEFAGERGPQRGRLPLAVSSIKTNIQRTRSIKRQMHQDPTSSDNNKYEAQTPTASVGEDGGAGIVGQWSGAAVNMASNAASAAWSALFPVSWGASFGNSPNENGVFSVRPAVIPLPVEHEHRPAGGLGGTRPAGSIRPPRSSSLSAGGGDSLAAPNSTQKGGGTKASAVQADLEFYRGRNLPLALNRATGEVFLVMINPVGLASVFGDRCLGVHFLLNRTGLGGDVVPTMLREMTLRSEPLHTIGVLFGQISTQSYYHRLKQQTERQRGNMGTGSGSSSSSQLTIITPSQRSPPKPYGKPAARVHRRAGLDSQRLYEVFPSADVQQQADCDFFRYEDAQWYYRGPSAVGANSETGAAASMGAAMSMPAEEPHQVVTRQASSFVVVGPEEGRITPKPSLGGNSSFSSTSSRPGAMTMPPPCFDQKQMCRYVFFPLVAYGTSLQERMHLESIAPTTTAATTAAAGGEVQEEAKEFYQFFLFTLLEYCRSLRQHSQLFSHTLQSTLIDVFLVLSNLGIPQYYRLQQLLMYRGIDSHVSIALKLVRLADHYPPAFQHALDMLWRLKEPTRIVDVLVAKALPLRAANFAWENKVRGINVCVILQCALDVEEVNRKATAHDKSHFTPSPGPGGQNFVTNNSGGQVVDPGMTDAHHGGRGIFVTCYILLTRYMEHFLEQNPDVSPAALLLPSSDDMLHFKQIVADRDALRPAHMLW